MYKKTHDTVFSKLETIQNHILEQWIELLRAENGFFLSNGQQQQNKDGSVQ